MDWITFAIVFACLLVSAFFAASETALTGASRASMLRLSKQGNREAGVVSSLIAIRERLIGALLLGNNIANIGASALATGIFTAWFGEVGVLYATGVMTALVVIFAEVLPKTIAINAPDRVSLLVARPMRLMLYLLGPLLSVVEAIVRVLMRMLGVKIGHNQPLLSPTERLRGAVDLIHHEGGVEKPARNGPISSFSELNTLPEPTSPPAECTVSTRPLIVNVSCASSTMFRTEYVHEYGAPICVGLSQPFVNVIP